MPLPPRALSVAIPDLFARPESWPAWSDNPLNASEYNLDWRFRYQYAVTPFTHVMYPILGIIVYLGVINLLQWVMNKRKPFEMVLVGIMHNYVLFVISLTTTLGVGLSVLRWLVTKGNSFTALMCDESLGMMKGQMAMWLYYYHLTKYYELFDTVIQVLRKRPLAFIHVYHHAIMLPLTWLWLHNEFVFAWWGILINSVVHVFMYYYYAAALVGRQLWWKRYLTQLQLAQFASVFVMIFYWLWVNARGNLSDVFTAQRCSGDVRTVLASQAVNVSFLFLFSRFYVMSYRRKQHQRRMAKDKLD